MGMEIRVLTRERERERGKKGFYGEISKRWGDIQKEGYGDLATVCLPVSVVFIERDIFGFLGVS